uniref:RING-H2 finger protein ATL60-like n=1 Tax=Nicotiana sylvestris TaxID=4096 RepID=A0A1U7VD38_NICSY|nr:PREDICTED: RING-H2 finger protein ATL60-like [Nicotiana sylvestris]
MGALTKLYLLFQYLITIFFCSWLPQVLKFIFLVTFVLLNTYRQRQLAKNRYKDNIDEKSSKFAYRRSIRKLIMGLSDGKETLECAICISEFKYGDKGRKLKSCSHMFHENCLEKWLMHGKGQSTCPLCRHIIISENIFEKQIKVEDEGQRKNSFEEELAMLLLSWLNCSSCWQRC